MINHVSAETKITGRMILSRTNSLLSELLNQL